MDSNASNVLQEDPFALRPTQPVPNVAKDKGKQEETKKRKRAPSRRSKPATPKPKSRPKKQHKGAPTVEKGENAVTGAGDVSPCGAERARSDGVTLEGSVSRPSESVVRKRSVLLQNRPQACICMDLIDELMCLLHAHVDEAVLGDPEFRFGTYIEFSRAGLLSLLGKIEVQLGATYCESLYLADIITDTV